VSLHRGRRRLLHVWPVLEVLAALRPPGGASEVVEGDGREAAFREAQRELLVEAVEAPDVREDDDPDLGRLLGRGCKRGEPVAVRSLERQVLVRDRSAAENRNR